MWTHNSLLFQVRLVTHEHDGELVAVFHPQDLFVELGHLKQVNFFSPLSIWKSEIGHLQFVYCVENSLAYWYLCGIKDPGANLI